LLAKRRPSLDSSNMLTIGGKLSLDFVILLAVAMGFALVCLFYVYSASCLSPRRKGGVVSADREQAMRQLRLRGGGGYATDTSPRRLTIAPVVEGGDGSSSETFVIMRAAETRPPSEFTRSSRPSSKTKLLPNGSRPAGPRRMTSGPRPTSTGRGYSVSSMSISKYARPSSEAGSGMGVERPGMPSHPSLNSLLVMPVMPGARGYDVDSAGSSSSTVTLATDRSWERPEAAGRAAYRVGTRASRYGQQPTPIVRTVSTRAHAFSPSASSSLGRGQDLQRIRSNKERNSRIHYPPEFDGSSPSLDSHHPLDLRRHITEPARGEYTRRDSTLSIGSEVQGFLSSNSRDVSPTMSPSLGGPPLSLPHSNYGHASSGNSSSGHDSLESPSARRTAVYADIPLRPQYAQAHESEAPTSADGLLAMSSPPRQHSTDPVKPPVPSRSRLPAFARSNKLSRSYV
jgi:hypothetical protein